MNEEQMKETINSVQEQMPAETESMETSGKFRKKKWVIIGAAGVW